MRKVLFAFFFILLLSNCKKDIQNNSAPNYWTVNEKKYNATQLGLNDYFYITHDSSGDFIIVKFAVDTIIQGTYTVVDYQTSLTNFPKNACILLGYISDYKSGFVTTGKAGDIVNVTKNSFGKLAFSFNNISVTDSINNILEVSGNLNSQ
jgi:hypothetical protein